MGLRSVVLNQSFSGLLLFGVAVTFFTTLSVTIYRIWFHPLSHVPGPFVAKFTHWWQNYSYFSGNWFDDILKVHEKYGPVVRISPDEISFVDGNALKRLYGHVKPCAKVPFPGFTADETRWYDTWYLPPAGHGIFSEQNIESHGLRRRLVANAYAMSSVLGYERKIQAILDTNWEQFRKFASAGEAIDMDYWATYFAYDIVSELALGNALGMVRVGHDVNRVMESVLGLFYFVSNMGHVPLQSAWMMNPISQFLINKLGTESMKGAAVFREWLTKSVADRYYSDKQREEKDMLQYFIEAKDREGNPNTFNSVLTEAGNVLGAGADTVSIGIRAIMIYLIQNPETYKRLQKEVDNFYDKNITIGEITYQQCLSLPFLQAVIKESGRMYPSIVYQIPRYVPPEGINIAGYNIPPGTPAGISALSMNRDKKIFGQDANTFRPERWLEDDAKAKYMDSLLATVNICQD